MPQLPEVETLRRDLAALVAGRAIAKLTVRDPRAVQGFSPSGGIRRNVDPARLSRALAGKIIRSVGRRGKYLLFHLDEPRALLCHLRMTGQLLYGAPRPDARALIHFTGQPEVLSFCDTRRFGEIWLAEDWTKDPSIAALGPEPFGDGWDVAAWGKSLRSSQAKIQAALLDQKRLAGLGNIYVTEALFLTGIRPGRRCHTLRADQIAPLAANIRKVLEGGLRHRGVSFYSYRDAKGEKGQALQYLSVYGLSGKACPLCRVTLKGMKISGRGTVYCPQCQK